MAILELPHDTEWQYTLTCAICHVGLSLDKATAGMLDANAHQAFACVSHFSEVEMLITGWADFLARERQAHFRQMLEAGISPFEMEG